MIRLLVFVHKRDSDEVIVITIFPTEQSALIASEHTNGLT